MCLSGYCPLRGDGKEQLGQANAGSLYKFVLFPDRPLLAAKRLST